MCPHPILMQSLYHDRTREVEALLFQQQYVAQGNAMRAPGLAYWRRVAIHLLALLPYRLDPGTANQ